MPEPYATIGDLVDRWRPLSASEETTAAALLSDASAMMRVEFPTLDARIAAGTMPVDITRMVACSMVKRAMSTSGLEGVSSQQESAGTLSRSVTYANPMGNIYLTKQDRRMLGRPVGRAFMVDLMPPAEDPLPVLDGS